MRVISCLFKLNEQPKIENWSTKNETQILKLEISMAFYFKNFKNAMFLEIYGG